MGPPFHILQAKLQGLTPRDLSFPNLHSPALSGEMGLCCYFKSISFDSQDAHSVD